MPRHRLTPGAVKGGAVLFSEMTPAPGDDARFNDWYDRHHTPNHVGGVPGFLSAHRYEAVDGDGYCAVYELVDPDVLESGEYRVRKYAPDDRTRAMLASVSGFTRYIGKEIACFGDAEDGLDAETLLAVFYVAGGDDRAALIRWHEIEHCPLLPVGADWLMSRMLDVTAYDPRPFTVMVLHYLGGSAARGALRTVEAHSAECRRRLSPTSRPAPHCVRYRRRGRRFLKTDTRPMGEKT